MTDGELRRLASAERRMEELADEVTDLLALCDEAGS